MSCVYCYVTVAYVCIPRSFLVINVRNQGKTLCSPCIKDFMLTLYFLQIHLKITLPSLSGISKRSLSFKLSHLKPCKYLFSYTRVTCPAHLILLNSATITLDEELSITQFSTVSSSHFPPS